MKYFLSLLAAIMLAGCSSAKLHAYQTESLTVEKIGTGLFVHTSYLETTDFGKVGCNGLIYINGEEAIVYDTPTDTRAARELIQWIQNTRDSKIIAVIPTHFHSDCLGSLEAFHQENIPSFASHHTISLAKERAYVLPQAGFEERLELAVGGEQVETLFFGEGHTADNVVGFIPAEATLFGGCLIKALEAGKGNLEDANTAAWADTVEKIREAFPDLQTVVPGHGNPGGADLLDYTIALFNNT